MLHVVNFDSRRPCRHVALRGKLPLHPLHRLFPVLHSALELRVFHRRQNLLEPRPRRIAHRNQVGSGHQRLRPDLLRRSGPQLLRHEFVQVQSAMARLAVDAMQFHVLVKLRQAQEPLQRRRLHALHIVEAHVVGHQRLNLLGVVVGEVQAPANLVRHRHPDFDVSVEPNAVRRHAKRRRLAHIVQQRSPRQRARAVRRATAPAASSCGSTHRPQDETAAAAPRHACARSPAALLSASPRWSSNSNACRAWPSVSILVSSSRTRSRLT